MRSIAYAVVPNLGGSTTDGTCGQMIKIDAGKDSGSPAGRLAAHEGPRSCDLMGHKLQLRRILWNFCQILQEHRSSQERLPKGGQL
jgi:hypothetical protein